MRDKVLVFDGDDDRQGLPGWMRFLTRMLIRYGVVPCVVISSLAATGASVAVSVLIYWIIDPQLIGAPVAMIMPIVIPLFVSPVFFWALLAPLERLHLRDRDLLHARRVSEAVTRDQRQILEAVSHEVRAPLENVVDTLQDLLDTDLDALQRELGETARYSGEALITVLDELLSLSREGDGTVAEPTVFELRRLVDSTVMLLSARAREKRLTLTATVASDLPARLAGDAGRIRQILIALIGNAIRVTDKGAVAIRVSPAQEALDSVPAGNIRVKFAVVDTAGTASGADGIDIFGTEDAGKAGLGLDDCERLARALGGEMGYEGAPGAGNMRWFTALLATDTTMATTSRQDVEASG